jgi:hypothetical protein
MSVKNVMIETRATWTVVVRSANWRLASVAMAFCNVRSAKSATLVLKQAPLSPIAPGSVSIKSNRTVAMALCKRSSGNSAMPELVIGQRMEQAVWRTAASHTVAMELSRLASNVTMAINST